ncbi:flagellar biosynthesis anti-sigma factor FlgM [Alkalicoccobacillus porphyridii]|uniref:Negative regulator of flagellin synthesis n=1 Tax=Alkalicoccobacillus porphyridii TaxID=2597270 RepID=A0A554A3S8_9BACI|nr:flagellar biosynthesis anti-sigma factor FlgM [Alkalicoccobacillus porphyridii]TSB48343.1 flagellar biosynthesis anti-sigma factor FlgM [Alkalicoccobacillus porphyridii]
MKINPYTSVQPSTYRTTNSTHQEESRSSKQSKDKLEISTEAFDMQGIKDVEKARAARVEEIKRQVEAGEYKVNAQKTAEHFYDYWKK